MTTPHKYKPIANIANSSLFFYDRYKITDILTISTPIMDMWIAYD